MTKTKWFIYTVLVGLIPILTRLVIFSVAQRGSEALLWNEGDFIAFGLVLNISNINSLEHEGLVDRKWKTKTFGISIVLIAVFAVLFALSCVQVLNESVIDVRKLKVAAAILSAGSFVFCYAVIDRLTKALSVGGRDE